MNSSLVPLQKAEQKVQRERDRERENGLCLMTMKIQLMLQDSQSGAILLWFHPVCCFVPCDMSMKKPALIQSILPTAEVTFEFSSNKHDLNINC